MPSFNCPDCGSSIPGTNCAHELSRQKRWKNIPGCYANCKCGYPVRAKELRNNTSITTKVPPRMHLSTVKMVGDKDMFTMGPSLCVLMEMDIRQNK